MTHLLVVETSTRGERSVSRAMTRAFLTAWQAAHPGATVTQRDLALTPLTFATDAWLQAYFTPDHAQSAAMRDVLQLSDTLSAELLAANHLVIATPVYNYNVPASLKAWVDHIVRKGVTLGFDGKGLLHGKRATVLIASGGVYAEGSPIRERDIATQYLRLILGVIGIVDVTFIAGGGAKSVDLGQATMSDFVATLGDDIDRAAASTTSST